MATDTCSDSVLQDRASEAIARVSANCSLAESMGGTDQLTYALTSDLRLVLGLADVTSSRRVAELEGHIRDFITALDRGYLACKDDSAFIDALRNVAAEARDAAEKRAYDRCPRCGGAGEVYRANAQDPASPTVICPQCEGTGKQEGAHLTGAEKLARRFWRIHPCELDAIGLTREQFYTREIDSLLAQYLSEPLAIVETYAAFIRTVPADDLEMHPYLPHLEVVAAELRAAIAKAAPPNPLPHPESDHHGY